MIAQRTAWNNFPDVILHAEELAVKKHPTYSAAKSGDADAAFALVQDTISTDAVSKLRDLIADRKIILVSAHAFERDGVNAIPEAFADELGRQLEQSTDDSIVQVNVVAHTGANGFARLARQALFDGVVVAGADYILVDDFIGQGGTLANMKGFIENAGGKVIGATVLTGKPYSAILTPSAEQLTELRDKHGKEFEHWWQDKFGHSFDCLTQSEARYLARTENVDTIRNRLATEE
ncbi:phosphoribosyltransferase [Undibacterium amnicola]|uniref:Phosphoribosyltransferase n=1 Tax=Undibacterium amnicola TaxID=1834038 RepID=A0ABR6XTN5_9BURK|nr:phosphoribosyltransferase [Undibacterium amnicola]MBC3832267.1 phosphoribosyltransferase [Undibacterium amnicola]